MNCRLKFEKPAATDRFDHFDELLDAQQARALLEVEFAADAPSPQCLQCELRIFCVVCAGEEHYPAFQWREGRLLVAPSFRCVVHSSASWCRSGQATVF